MDRNPYNQNFEQRKDGFLNLIHRFSLKYQIILAFLAGWTAIPIGTALLALLAR